MMKKFLTVIALLLSTGMIPIEAQIGDPAPDFTVTDTHGNTHNLYEYVDAGHVVVLDFFYTTCIPCQFYSPQVNLAYEKYGCNTDEVIFISIDYDDSDAEVIAYDEEYNIEFPSVSGLEGGGNGVVSQYGIFGFPTFYVIDSTRTIIDQIDPPTLQVFDFRFAQHGIEPAACNTSLEAYSSQYNRIQIYPNPLSAGNPLTVELPGHIKGLISIELFDMMGRTIRKGAENITAEPRVQFHLENLLPGLYGLKVVSRTDHQSFSGVFVY